MKQGNIFTKSRKEAPKDEVSRNADLLIRAGFIHKEMAGVYDLLYYGLRVMKKIENIVRNEMNQLGAQEINMASLQDPSAWKKTNRWDDDVVDNWFKTKLKNDNDLGLATTHEEPITNLMKNHITSYKDLPILVYQFQTKFRNELRAKSGLMRGREFLMKDLYSFNLNKEEHDKFYEKAKQAYINIFNKLGIGDKTHLTFASGGSFAKFSHEFQTVSESGEDTVYYHPQKNIAINKEVMNSDSLGELAINENDLVELKTVEVGNIFTLADKFSTPLELTVDDQTGNRIPVFMGSYGIGIGRLMAVIAENFADDKGLVWPSNIAPFDCHLINLLDDKSKSDSIYSELLKSGVDVLYDDRDQSPGKKLSEADLIGIPYQIIIGKNFTETGLLEFVERKSGEKKSLELNEILMIINDKKNG